MGDFVLGIRGNGNRRAARGDSRATYCTRMQEIDQRERERKRERARVISEREERERMKRRTQTVGVLFDRGGLRKGAKNKECRAKKREMWRSGDVEMWRSVLVGFVSAQVSSVHRLFVFFEDLNDVEEGLVLVLDDLKALGGWFGLLLLC